MKAALGTLAVGVAALPPLALLLVWAALPALALALALVVLALALVVPLALLVDRYRLRRRLVVPDDRGLLPVDLAAVEAGQLPAAALASYHAAQLARASVAPVPHTYSPHVSVTERPAPAIVGTQPAQLAAPAPAGAELVTTAPSFRQMLDAGEVGRGRPLVLGYADGAPVVGSWLDLYSCGIGGLSGSGKSWTAVYLAAQAALYGCRLVILDPHAGDGESLAARLAPLAGRFVCEVAESPKDMQAAVGLVMDEYGRRRQTGRGPGWIVLADEFSSLQRGALAEPLAQMGEMLGQEGRKLGLYGLFMGQVWTASRAGGSELRDSLASAYVHRLRPAQARYLTGLTAAELPGDLLDLPPGGAYLLSTAGDLRRVTIPQLAPGDVGRVAALLEGDSTPTASPDRRSIGFRPAIGGGASGGASGEVTDLPHRGQQDAENLSAEEAAIVADFLAGKSTSELAAALNGGKKSGDGFNQAARRVADILRRALKGGR